MVVIVTLRNCECSTAYGWETKIPLDYQKQLNMRTQTEDFEEETEEYWRQVEADGERVFNGADDDDDFMVLDDNEVENEPGNLNQGTVDDINGFSPDSSSSKRTLRCPVCLDPLQGLPDGKEVRSTPCGHLFCSVCLGAALLEKKQCPTCRGEMDASQSIRLFL